MADPPDPILGNVGIDNVEGGGNNAENQAGREDEQLPPPLPIITEPFLPIPVDPGSRPMAYIPRPDTLMRPASQFVPFLNGDGRKGTPGAGSSRDNV
jgi:hypothetical protein